MIKCGLCKEEIEYAQRCRVYIKTNETRPVRRISKRPHIGRYKLISTAKSTEHISFARRLKRLRQNKNQKISDKSSVDTTENIGNFNLWKKPMKLYIFNNKLFYV